ncbi:MAG: sterol desaturase family protein [Rubrivivax sp.]|nr:sterol desaturase family protein [Rubrivivax sp.]
MNTAERRTGPAPAHEPARTAAPVLAQALSVLAFPAALAAAIGLALGLPALGAAPELALAAVLAVSLTLVWLAEWAVPYDRTPRRAADRDLAVDGTSMALLMAVVDPVLKAGWPVLVVALWGLLGRPEGLGLLDGDQPLVLKLPAALLVAGLGEYLLHRLSHRWAPMWGFHALHHSAGRIYWLNGFRAHPVNLAWHQLAGYALLLWPGVDAQTLTAFAAVSIAVNVFQHANARLRLGLLNRVFSTNELHRWHHDSRPGQSQVNFGNVLSVWDQVFGTYRHRPGEEPGAPGLEAASARRVRANRYWAQVVGPFRRLGVYATAADRDGR